MKKKQKIINANRVVFNCQMMDLIKLRIVVDSHSNPKRIPVNNSKTNYTSSDVVLKKVLKSDRHK